jgi:hypothetical protein
MSLSAPQLRLGQVFWISKSELLVCVRVNDCSARVVATSMDKVQDTGVIYDEFDRHGYRITACPELEPDKTVCVLPRNRIKVNASQFKPISSPIVGFDIIPLVDRSVPVSIRKAKKRAEDREALKRSSVNDAIKDLLEVSARVATGVIRSILKSRQASAGLQHSQSF